MCNRRDDLTSDFERIMRERAEYERKRKAAWQALLDKARQENPGAEDKDLMLRVVKGEFGRTPADERPEKEERRLAASWLLEMD